MTVEQSELEKIAKEFAQRMTPQILEQGKGLTDEQLARMAVLEGISARLGHELGKKQATKAEKKAEGK